MTVRKPEILVLLGCFTPGNEATGPNQSLLNMVRTLGDRFTFRVIAEAVAGETAGRWTMLLGIDRLPLTPTRFGARGLAAALRTTRADLIVSNGFFDRQFTLPLLLLRRFGRLRDAPVMITPHGEFSPGALTLKARQKRLWLRIVETFGLLRGTHLQATVDRERADIAAVLPKHADAILIGPNVQRLPPLPPHVERMPGAPLRIAFLSRIDRKKGLHTALDRLAEAGVTATLDIFGPISDDVYWQECQARIVTLPASVDAHWRGAIAQSQVVATLAAYDLFILPTLGENFGYAIVDALAAGTPALLSDQTPWDGLERAGAGWTLPLDAPDRYVAALRTAAAWDADERRRRRDAARAYIEATLDHAADVSALANCLTRAMDPSTAG